MDVLLSIKAIIASKKLFKNWILAAIKYLLIKYGLVKGNVTIKCNGKAYTLTPEIYWVLVKTHYQGILKSLVCENNITVTIIYDDKEIHFHDSLPFLPDIIFENFISGVYNDLDIEGRTVIDIGAGVGDTTILFVLRGARRVIALEPYPSLYKKALINVKINGVEDRVVLVNAGLGSFDDEICTEIRDVNGYYLFKPSSKCDIKVKMYTLSSLIREFRIAKGSILKMDCEGCEYDALLSAKPEDLKLFGQIIIEYHNGYRELKKALENSRFKVTIKPIRSITQSIEKQGYIVATHKNL
jgi:FkbM family methyltransferase